MFETIINGFILPIMTCVVTIILSFILYNYRIKRKNKYIILKSIRLEVAKGLFDLVKFFPGMIICFQLGLNDLIGFDWTFNITEGLTVVIYLIMGFCYIRNAIRWDNENNIIFKELHFMDKMKFIYYNFILPIVAIFFSLSIAFILTSASMELAYLIANKIVNSILVTTVKVIITYGFNVLLAYIIYYLEKWNIKKKVREIKVYYMQNGEEIKKCEIDYDELDITKEFVSIIIGAEKYNIMIPIKDLLRIEFYY